jgi:hypothetical protein
VPGWQVFHADPDDLFIQIDHHGLLDTAVAEHFAQGCAFTSSRDVDRTRVRVTQHGRMDEGFMVNEFIYLGRLDFSVQQENQSESFGFHQFHILKSGAECGHLPLEFQKEAAVLCEVVEN